MLKELSTYMSEDGKKSAVVFMDQTTRTPVVWFWENGAIVGKESYPNHSESYHEDAAENYVLGVKTF